jgi:hypothetical protein
VSRLTIAFYRLPTATSTQIGQLRAVLDRHKQVYLAGSKVVTAAPSGEFMVLTLANDQVYYVKTSDYEGLREKPTGRR